MDINPTNPILVESNGPGIGGGISINANLDSTIGPETMYYVANTGMYFFWNGTSWTNTYHTSGSAGAINPGGTSDYIFNLDGNASSLYRYDGTTNGTLLLSNLNTVVTAMYDVATDNQGNFYLFYANHQKIFVYNSNGIPIDTFTTTGLLSGGGGLALLGNRIYATPNIVLYEGIKTGNNITFTPIKNLPFGVSDIATCHEISNPLSVFSDNSPPHSRVYPNPFFDKLNVLINNNMNIEVILYDISSRKLLQQKFTNSVTLNTEQLAKGMYLYQVLNKNGVIQKGKVVKQ